MTKNKIAACLATVMALATAGAGAAPLMTGAYKDVSQGIDPAAPQIALPAWTPAPRRGEVLIWAFASGDCGQERWGDFDTEAFARANVRAHEAAGRDYILSTGGAIAVFRCDDDAAMARFVERYAGPRLRGIDFDIE